jgi:electron transfer flavoprotein-quinone oxidoreductase
LYGDGILVAGDAAGFALNMGVTVRGMEFAIASGIMAAETIIDAKEKGDFSSKTLSSYEKRLKDTFVLQDLSANKEMPGYIENDDFFTFYPERFPDFLEKIVWFGEGPKEKIGKTLWNGIKSSGILSFRRLRDLYRIKNL